MSLLSDMWSWLGYRGLFALFGAAITIIVVTNFTIKIGSNLLIISVYDFVNIAAFIVLISLLYFIAYVCSDVSVYRFFGVFSVVSISSAIPLVLFYVRAPLFTDAKFNFFSHLVMPLTLALMAALITYPFVKVTKTLFKF
jgi:hypothetical protein